jgi:photosystem II stability/assembly factor-like uncharacterized protein
MSWTITSAPNFRWNCVTSSSNGTILVAGILGGGIYRSIDGGSTWLTTNAPTDGQWTGLACSSDGTKLVAVSTGSENSSGVTSLGYIYTSTNSGSSWTKANAPFKFWQSVASDSSGTNLVAAAPTNGRYATYNGGIFTSNDGGSSWQEQTTNVSNRAWWCVESNSTGEIIFAVNTASGLYRSNNYGGNWSIIQTGSTWWCIASNSTGGNVVAGMYSFSNSFINKSSDGGGAWVSTNAPNKYWISIASNSSGTKLLAGTDPGVIYTSIDSGATWVASTIPSLTWYSVASDSSGDNLVAVTNGAIYTSRSNQPPVPVIASTNYYTVQSGQTKDLSQVFQPLITTPAALTGFVIANYNGTGINTDLNQNFEPYITGYEQADATNFIIKNYNNQGVKDLNQIFAKYNPYIITNKTSNLNVTTINYGGYTGLIFENTSDPYLHP